MQTEAEALRKLNVSYQAVYRFAFAHLHKTWANVGELVAGGAILSDPETYRTLFMSHTEIVALDLRLRNAWLAELERRLQLISIEHERRDRVGEPRLPGDVIAQRYGWAPLEYPSDDGQRFVTIGRLG